MIRDSSRKSDRVLRSSLQHRPALRCPLAAGNLAYASTTLGERGAKHRDRVTPSQRLQSAYTVASASQGLFGGPIRCAMKIKRLPAGFVVPAQPINASKPPSGADWVHEIKHDGNRLIVRRDGPTVRLYTRNAYDWTVRLPAIAAAAGRIKAKSFTPRLESATTPCPHQRARIIPVDMIGLCWLHDSRRLTIQIRYEVGPPSPTEHTLRLAPP